MSLIHNLYFAAFVFSLIVFVDLMVKFRQPLLLKFYFSILVVTTSLAALMHYIGVDQFVFYIVYFKLINIIAFFNIFSTLYFPKVKKIILTLGIVMFIAMAIYGYVRYFVFQKNGQYYLDSQNHLFVKGINARETPIIFIVIRYFFSAIYSCVILYFSYHILYRINHSNIYFKKIKKWTISILTLTVVFNIHNLPLPIYTNYPIIGYFVTIAIYFMILLIIYYRPTFLNNGGVKISFGARFNFEKEIAVSEANFVAEFFTNLYYKNPDASLEGLAKILNVSSNELYRHVYNKHSLTFNDLVNKYRVIYFLEIARYPEFANYTIDALAKEAGFSSRQHLYKPFKKFHGGIPSDLIDAVND